MRRLVIAVLMLAVLAAFASADMPRPAQAIHEEIFPHGDGGARGLCSIVHYNVCSGWAWTWSGWAAGDIAGVIFDLPQDCGHSTDTPCSNTKIWWRWRHTMPGRGFSEVTYRIYEVDQSNCIVGEPLAEYHSDPVENWNLMPGFGDFDADRILLAVSWDQVTLPRLNTDRAIMNHNVGCAPEPVAHSFFFGNPQRTMYCPPLLLEDSYGPCNILMDAEFDCQTTATEPASWGSIKALFK
ncbi:MAG: hypothetical protein JW958_02845 [Candidatus Eisenbacteria bacterium]|nr:hypothetical protein [Candidatus Eisenbacteria bacterium]